MLIRGLVTVKDSVMIAMQCSVTVEVVHQMKVNAVQLVFWLPMLKMIVNRKADNLACCPIRVGAGSNEDGVQMAMLMVMEQRRRRSMEWINSWWCETRHGGQG